MNETLATDDSGNETDVNTEVESKEELETKPEDSTTEEPTAEVESSDEESRNAPENLEDYVFEAVEGVDVADDVVGEFREVAKELDLSPEQYAGVVAYELNKAKQWNESAPEREKAANEQAETEAKEEADRIISERKKDLGPGYDKAIGFQQKALSDFGVGDLVESPLANNDMFFKFAVEVGKALSEGKINSGGSPVNVQNPIGEDGREILKHKDTDKV